MAPHLADDLREVPQPVNGKSNISAQICVAPRAPGPNLSVSKPMLLQTLLLIGCFLKK